MAICIRVKKNKDKEKKEEEGRQEKILNDFEQVKVVGAR